MINYEMIFDNTVLHLLFLVNSCHVSQCSSQMGMVLWSIFGFLTQMKLVTPDKLHEPWRFVDERIDRTKGLFCPPSEGAINFIYQNLNAGKLFDKCYILCFLTVYDDVDVNAVIVFVLVVWFLICYFLFGLRIRYTWCKQQTTWDDSNIMGWSVDQKSAVCFWCESLVAKPIIQRMYSKWLSLFFLNMLEKKGAWKEWLWQAMCQFLHFNQRFRKYRYVWRCLDSAGAWFEQHQKLSKTMKAESCVFFPLSALHENQEVFKQKYAILKDWWNMWPCFLATVIPKEMRRWIHFSRPFENPN